jgi:hypothetical protein
MTTLRQHVDDVIVSEDWCKSGAAIVDGRDPDTAAWYGEIESLNGFVTIWWIANPDDATAFVLGVVSQLVAAMDDCDAKTRLDDLCQGSADLDECIAWCDGRLPDTDCCKLVGKLAARLKPASTAQKGYGMLNTLVRSYQSVHKVGVTAANATLLAAAKAACPLATWRGDFE